MKSLSYILTIALFSLVFFSGVKNTHAMSDFDDPWSFTGPNGKITQMSSLYLQPIAGLQAYQERFDFELEQTVSDYRYSFRLVPWLWFRIPNAEGGDPRFVKPYFELKEAWGVRVSDIVDFRIGNQIITWGAADQINPTDVWNPRDLYDPFLNYKLPQPTARISIHPLEYDQFALDILGTPFFKESRLPLVFPEGNEIYNLSKLDSRWLSPLPNKVSTSLFTAPVYYKLAAPTYPSTWQLGARLQVTRVLGWDFSLSTMNGVEKTPRMTFLRQGDPSDPALPITLTILPSYHRMHMWGVDGTGSLTLMERVFGIRFESAYVIRNNSRAYSAGEPYASDLVKDDYIHSVLGIDHTFPKQILGTVLYLNLMGVYFQRTGNLESPPGRALVEGLPSVDPWDRNLVLYVEDRINTAFKISNTLITSLRNFDGWIHPELSAHLIDNFKMSLSGDFFFRTRLDGFYGQYAENRRINFSCSYAF